jgi:hypothetical protein
MRDTSTGEQRLGPFEEQRQRPGNTGKAVEEARMGMSAGADNRNVQQPRKSSQEKEEGLSMNSPRNLIRMQG